MPHIDNKDDTVHGADVSPTYGFDTLRFGFTLDLRTLLSTSVIWQAHMDGYLISDRFFKFSFQFKFSRIKCNQSQRSIHRLE